MRSAFRRVIVTGADGQLGLCLRSIAPKGTDLKIFFFGHSEFDLLDVDGMRSTIEDINPDYIVNCAAYTDVEGAEDNPDDAQNLNHFALIDLSNICAERKIKLFHISTDFVFDGRSRKPYNTDDLCGPLNIYGRTKVLGEHAIQVAIPEDSMIIRTSWLYSEFGSNFVKTMLHLYNTQESFRVVHNQEGTPTYALGLAELIWHVLVTRQFTPGIYHWCDKGKTTWYDFAIAIGEKGVRKGLIESMEKKAAAMPILSSEYLTKAERPMYSCLYSYHTLRRYTKFRQFLWQDHLERMLGRLIASRQAA